MRAHSIASELLMPPALSTGQYNWHNYGILPGTKPLPFQEEFRTHSDVFERVRGGQGASFDHVLGILLPRRAHVALN